MAYTLTLPGGFALYGGAAADALSVLTGDNWLGGGGGGDTLDGGSGQDLLFGEDGADLLNGGLGDDTLFGGAGNDILIGGAGFDFLAGGPGNDQIQGGADNDLLSYEHAAGGVSVSLAISTPQTVGGGEGVDTISEIESLVGSAFADTLTGDAGVNILEGRAGDDTLIGGDGFDRAFYRFAEEGVRVDLSIVGRQFISPSEGSDTLIGIEGLVGSHFNDQLFGDRNNNNLAGRMGDDEFMGGGGFDTIDGGQGEDVVIFTGQSTDYSVSTDGQGRRVITDNRPGSPDGTITLIDVEIEQFDDFARRITTAPAYDLAIVASPLAVIEADQGLALWTIQLVRSGDLGKNVNYNWLIRGAGDNPAKPSDFFGLTPYSGIFGFPAGQTTVTLTIPIVGNLARDGNRTFEFVVTTPNGPLVVPGVILDNETPPPDEIRLRLPQGDVIQATPGQTTISAGTGDDLIVGGEGSDNLFGGAGDDRMLGEDGADTLDGGDGNDFLRGGRGDDVLRAGPGGGSLRGDQGNDTLDGGPAGGIARYDAAAGPVTVNLSLAGPQAIGADQGTDTLINIRGVVGSIFADRLTGGSGSEIFAGGAGNDTIDGGGGFDYVSFTTALGGVTVDLRLTGPQPTGGGEGVDTITGIEGVIGSSYADRLTGDGSNNRLDGGHGNDTLSGAGGYDFLFGDEGDDTAVFSGPVAAYTRVQRPDSVWVVTDTRGGSPDGTSELVGVELLRFSDQIIRIASAPSYNFRIELASSLILEGDGAISLLTARIIRSGDLSETDYGWRILPTGASPALAADFLGGFTQGSEFWTGSAHFAAGETTAQILIPVRGNTTVQPNRTFEVQLLAPTAVPVTAVVTIIDDDGLAPQQLVGAVVADTLYGKRGDDQFEGGGGDDLIDGRAGVDRAIYSGAAKDYAWWQAADGSWRVQDLSVGGFEGTDTLVGVEQLQFSDRTLKIIGASPAETLTAAFENVMRRGATSPAEQTFLINLVGEVAGGTKTLTAAYGEIAQRADGSTAVAAMTYQFFLGFVPSKAGFDFLVSPAGPNPTNINSPYYQFFNQENRYINFAVNVGAGGDGRGAFLAEFGSLTLREATRKAYAEIFGNIPGEAKLDALLDAPVGGGLTRKDYLALYGGDGLTGLGTKAAMVGFLLSAAAGENQGFYARSTAAYFTDLADGAQFLIDIIGAYNQPEWAFGG